jgi:hypothetical protein
MLIFFIKPIYFLIRLFRRLLPERLAHRLLSNDYRPETYYVSSTLTSCQAFIRDHPALLSGTLLEIGPGAKSPLSPLLLNHGAQKVILLEPHFPPTVTPQLHRRLSTIWDKAKTIFPTTIDIHQLFKIDAFNPDLITILPESIQKTHLESECIQQILSLSVMEHIPEPSTAFAEQYRLLKPGGKIWHKIDLRDHFFRFPMGMLLFSQWTWEKLLTNKHKGIGFQNRLRLPDYLNLLKTVGFQNIQYNVLETFPERFLQHQKYFHPDFARFSRKDLEPAIITLSAQKPD